MLILSLSKNTVPTVPKQAYGGQKHDFCPFCKLRSLKTFALR